MICRLFFVFSSSSHKREVSQGCNVGDGEADIVTFLSKVLLIEPLIEVKAWGDLSAVECKEAGEVGITEAFFVHEGIWADDVISDKFIKPSTASIDARRRWNS